MGRSVETGLSEHGVSWPEYLALRVACERPGLSQQALAERIAVDKTCMSRAIELLEDHALVYREPGIDRRQRLVRVTDAGRAWRDRFEFDVEAAERAALLPLDPRERARVRKLLGKLIAKRRPTFLDFLQ